MRYFEEPREGSLNLGTVNVFVEQEVALSHII